MREGDELNFGYVKKKIKEQNSQVLVIFPLEFEILIDSFCSERPYPFLYKTKRGNGSDEHQTLEGIEMMRNKKYPNKRGGDFIWS